MALRYHPDRNPDDKTAEERFKEAAEAYAVLADAGQAQPVRPVRACRRRRRHRRRGPGFDPTIFADFGDILGGLGDLFGGGSARRSGVRRGSDLRYDLEISFEEAATGLETTLQIPREEPCDTCSGSGAALAALRKRAATVRAAARSASSRGSSPWPGPARSAAGSAG